MDSSTLLREPYEVIVAKLELAELTIELDKITKEKWLNHEEARRILLKEEEILEKIRDKAKAYHEMVGKLGDGQK